MLAKLMEKFDSTVGIERDGVSSRSIELVGEWDYELVALADGQLVRVNMTRQRFRRVTTDGKFVESGKLSLAIKEGKITNKFVLLDEDTWKFEKNWNKKNHI